MADRVKRDDSPMVEIMPDVNGNGFIAVLWLEDYNKLRDGYKTIFEGFTAKLADESILALINVIEVIWPNWWDRNQYQAKRDATS